MVISGGNNVLFVNDVEQTLLTPCCKAIEVVDESVTSLTLRVEAAVEWDDVVEWCVERDLWGAENLSLIPGKAGAAPIQNIGAYGVEVAQLIKYVEYFDPSDCKVKRIMRQECRFGYRQSIFKGEWRAKMVVLAIVIELSKLPNPQLNYADIAQRVEARGGATLRNIRDVIVEVRREKLPDTNELGNAGSFFKNPIVERSKAVELQDRYASMPIYPVDEERVKLAAGWLIDQAQMKGYRDGAVGVHTSQALVLVNHGGASGAEVVALAQKVQQRVEDKFGVKIEAEVNIV